MNSSPIKTRRGGVSPLRDQMLDQSQKLKQEPEFNYEANVGGVNEDNEEEIKQDIEYVKNYQNLPQNQIVDSLTSYVYNWDYKGKPLYDYQDIDFSDEAVMSGLSEHKGEGAYLGDELDEILKPRKTDRLKYRKQYEFGYTEQDRSKGETIMHITAENHPLYGNTYIRRKVENPDFKTIKPINELNELLKGYVSKGQYGESTIDLQQRIGLPTSKGGESEDQLIWGFAEQDELEDWINKIKNISDKEKEDLIRKSKKIHKKFYDNKRYEITVEKNK
tara:strand:+ start:238 stop:1065 length:828 start_codon:yes stop_codon:yes gene_type:complete